MDLRGSSSQSGNISGAFTELEGRQVCLNSTAKAPALYNGLQAITVSYPLITL